jgi:hypothetical protein
MPFSRATRSRIAWLQSLFKRSFEFSDYPVDYVDQGEPSRNPDIDPSFRWRADLLGLHYCGGLGPTPVAALEDAKQKFNQAKLRTHKLPRPGSKPKIEFAAAELVSGYPKLQEHFIHEVLGLEWAFISDESTLEHFDSAEIPRFLDRIREVYDVELNTQDLSLAAIFGDLMLQLGTFPETEEHRRERVSRRQRR